MLPRRLAARLARPVLLRNVAPPRGVPSAVPSALRALCSSSDGSGDGGDRSGRRKPGITSTEAAEEADGDDALFIDDASEVGDDESSIAKIDPTNVWTLPPLLVFPFPTRPLFPGVFQPAEASACRASAAAPGCSRALP